MIEVPQEELEELYTTRLLCFLETSPQSNKYHQVLLNAEEFKRFSFSIGDKTEDLPNGAQGTFIKMSEETYALPDLKQIQDEGT